MSSLLKKSKLVHAQLVKLVVETRIASTNSYSAFMIPIVASAGTIVT